MHKVRIGTALESRRQAASEASIITIGIVCCACAIVLVLAVAIGAAT